MTGPPAEARHALLAAGAVILLGVLAALLPRPGSARPPSMRPPPAARRALSLTAAHPESG